jgi:glutathione S-transferase
MNRIGRNKLLESSAESLAAPPTVSNDGTDTRLPVLYSYRRCPYAIRARMALWMSGVSIEVREISFQNKPTHLLALSPKGTVPVLWWESPEGTLLLEESLDIMTWAHTKSKMDASARSPSASTPKDALKADAPFLVGPDDLLLVTENDTTFKRHLDRYKYPDRLTDCATTAAESRTKCVQVLASYEARLGVTPFLRGNQISLADLAVFPFVRQFAAVEPQWFEQQPYPALHRWLHFFMEHPAFTSVMIKVPVWIEGGPTCVLKAHHAGQQPKEP